jgi:cytochrome c
MRLILMFATLSLTACGSAKPEKLEEAEPSATAAIELPAVDAAPSSFAQCGVCHKVEAGAPNGLGPNLHGIVGKKSGISVGYSYSPAMKAAGLIWDEKTLDSYLTKPQALVPGTRMSYAGQADAAKRAEIIAWLKKNS